MKQLRSTTEQKGHLEFTGYAAGEYTNSPSITRFSLNELYVAALGRLGDGWRWKADLQLDHRAHWSDVYLRRSLVHDTWLQIGQFKVPFSQESLSGKTTIATIERPQSVTYLTPGRENHGGGQELGAQVSGDLLRVRGKSWLSYATGFFSGHTLNMPGGPRPRQAAFRLVSSPLPLLMLAADYARGAAPGQPWARVRTGLEAGLHVATWKFQTEYIAGHDGALEHRGAYAQAVWRFLPQWDAIVLADHYRPELRVTDKGTDSLLGGFNWYLTRTLRMQINEGVRRTRPDPVFKPYFLCQLQWRFR